MSQSRRRLKRSHLLFYLKLVNRNTGDLVGHLVDITTEGIRLISENPIPTDTIFKLRMVLPAGFSASEHLDIDAKSLWCQRSENPDLFETGLQLICVTDELSKTIEDLIADSGFAEY